MIKKAERVEEVPDALRPEPLAEGNFDLFVNTDSARDEVIPRTLTLKDELKTELNPKILFAGHRGSGKSTEINRLIRDIKDEYFVVKFSVRDETDIYNINHVDLDLFSGQGLDIAIAKTGGVLRDLFRAIERAATAAPYHKEEKIQDNRIAYGLNIVKNEYNDMIVGIKEGDFEVTTESLYEKLDEIKSSKSKVFQRDDALQVLLNCQAVIEYNGNQWFDVHPLVIDLLHDMGKE